MRSAAPNLRLGRLAAMTLACLVTGEVCRAEVGSFWATGPQDATIVGYKMMQIGDDPDPIPPTIWRAYSEAGSGRVVLNPEGEAHGDGAPSLLADPGAGLLVAAWARWSASGFDVVVSRFQGGVWSVPQVVIDTAASALDPQLAQDASGNIHMFYWTDGATPQVFHVEAPADLSSWSAPALVSHPGQAACRPSGAVFQDVLRVAYEVHVFGYGNAPRQVVLARFDGGAFVPEIVAITNNPGEVRPEVHAHADRMWVEWVDAETTGGSGEIAWTRLNAQGHWEPIRYESFAGREQRDFLVRGGVRLKAIE